MDSLKKIIKILITVLIIVVVIKFFIYALPFIIVLLFGYLVYLKVKQNNVEETIKSKKKINKNNKVFEGEVVNERLEK